MSCTYVSTTACLSTVIHHTRTAHFVCKALRADNRNHHAQAPRKAPRRAMAGRHAARLAGASVRTDGRDY